MFRFEKLHVYVLAKELHREVVFITKKVPLDLEYLKLQIRRAALSIVLNIAEGSGKGSDRDFNRYIKNALGSLTETVAGLQILQELTEIDPLKIIKRYNDLQNLLGAFSKKLQANG